MNRVNKEVDNHKLVPQVDAPRVAISIDELDIPQAVVENLVLKHLSAYPKSDVLHLVRLMGINSHIIEELLALLRKKSHVEVFQSEQYSQSSTNSHVRYALSEQGNIAADSAFQKDPYLGPVPVSLSEYKRIVKSQDLRLNTISKTALNTAFNDVHGAERLVSTLGPAINSGRALLLYGDAGTGKSFVMYGIAQIALGLGIVDKVLVLGPPSLTIERELTKKFEETLRGTAQELVTHFKQKAPKGEIVLIVAGKN